MAVSFPTPTRDVEFMIGRRVRGGLVSWGSRKIKTLDGSTRTGGTPRGVHGGEPGRTSILHPVSLPRPDPVRSEALYTLTALLTGSS